MSFQKTYFFYLSFIVGLPTLTTGLVTKSVWWTIGVFVLTNVLARLLISLFHWLFRAIGDKSDNSKLNTTLRLVLTENNYEAVLKRIFPDDNLNSLVTTSKDVAQTLVTLGGQVDKKMLTEAEARNKIQTQFPFIDKGNTDWLNNRGRIFLRHKAKVFGQATT